MNMSKIIYTAFCLFLLISLISACKKGEDDPFLSLRSRKVRLVGEWTLKSGTYKALNQGATTTGGYANGREDRVTIYYAPSDTLVSSKLYKQTYAFEKDGSYQKTTVSETGTATEEGVWSFVQRSKSDDLKNKEAILLSPRKFTGQGNETVFGGSSDAVVYVLTQLKNKRMVWSASFSREEPGSYAESVDETFTFEQ